MIVDEWGPFDYRSPKLWPLDSVRTVPLRLRVVGPAGRWNVAGLTGVVSVSKRMGVIGDTLFVTPHPDSLSDWRVNLEYVGAAVRTPRGETVAAGTRYPFSYGRFEPRQDWNVRFFTWTDTTTNNTVGAAADRALASTPIVTRRESRLDYFWFRPTITPLPQAKWAFDATATVNLPGDRSDAYTLRTISDDGVRVWVDGQLVIDRWTHHESTVDHATIGGGRHDVRVQYFQSDGWSEIRVDFVKGTERSKGSAGPH